MVVISASCVEEERARFEEIGIYWSWIGITSIWDVLIAPITSNYSFWTVRLTVRSKSLCTVRAFPQTYPSVKSLTFQINICTAWKRKLSRLFYHFVWRDSEKLIAYLIPNLECEVRNVRSIILGRKWGMKSSLSWGQRPPSTSQWARLL